MKLLGFGEKRQEAVSDKRNEDRFRGNCGVSSLAVSKVAWDLQTLLEEEHRIKDFRMKYFFLTVFWMKVHPTHLH